MPLMTHNRDGSALIIAVIFTSMLALFVIPSYLKLSNATVRMSHRTFYNVAAHDLAESGIEHGVWALRQAEAGADPWGEWTILGNDARITIDDFATDGDDHGTVNVYIRDYLGANPEIIAKGRIMMAAHQPVEKYMYAIASASPGQGLFAFGMLARDSISAEGGVRFDSWISDPDRDPATPFIPYSRSVARDRVSIAAAGTGEGAIALGSSDVYGTAAVGSSTYRGLDMSWGGQVGPADPTVWDPSDTQDLYKKDPPGWLVSTETGALSTGFTAEFEDVEVPESAIPEQRGSYLLPYHTGPRNRYVDKETLGAPGTTTVLEMNSLTVKAGATLTIAGDVTLILPRTHYDALNVIEGGAIRLAEDARLTVYVAGDINVTGAGLFNQLQPQQFQIWGTAPGSQDFDFLNNGQFSGTVYAPNANIRVTGDSDLYGSIVANKIQMTGSGSFRYDESLKDLTSPGSGAGPTTVDYVEELTGDERTSYRELLDF